MIKRTINKQQKIKHGEAQSIFHVLIRNQTILQIAFIVKIILLESILDTKQAKSNNKHKGE